MRNYNMLKLREERGLTQEQLAELSGVSRQTITSIERGSVNPTYPIMSKICVALEAESMEDVFPIIRE